MILKEELFCDNCSKFTGKSVYIVVGRGILMGIAETLEVAKELLNELNQEKIPAEVQGGSVPVQKEMNYNRSSTFKSSSLSISCLCFWSFHIFR
jgi:hypothetical protein